MPMRDLYIEGPDVTQTVKALSSDTRLKMLELLDEREMSIQMFCEQLFLSKTAVINHLAILEKGGLIIAKPIPGTVGNQKVFVKAYDRLIFNFTPHLENEDRKQYYEIEIMPGNFFDFMAYPPCGMADESRIIQKWDDPSVFLNTDRVAAQLVWMSYGFLEYRIPLNIPFEDLGLDKISILMEISAQGGLSELDSNGVLSMHEALKFPDGLDTSKTQYGDSDITVYLSNVELTTFTVSDFSRYQRAGRFTPTWWRGSAYGKLVDITVNSAGTYLDGQLISPVTMDNVINQDILTRNRALKVGLISCDYLPLRIGIKPSARHISGMTLFGKGFGNYSHGILVRFY